MFNDGVKVIYITREINKKSEIYKRGKKKLNLTIFFWIHVSRKFTEFPNSCSRHLVSESNVNPATLCSNNLVSWRTAGVIWPPSNILPSWSDEKTFSSVQMTLFQNSWFSDKYWRQNPSWWGATHVNFCVSSWMRVCGRYFHSRSGVSAWVHIPGVSEFSGASIVKRMRI